MSALTTTTPVTKPKRIETKRKKRRNPLPASLPTVTYTICLYLPKDTLQLDVHRYLNSVDKCCAVERTEDVFTDGTRLFQIQATKTDPLSLEYFMRCCSRFFGDDQQGIPDALQIEFFMKNGTAIPLGDLLEKLLVIVSRASSATNMEPLLLSIHNGSSGLLSGWSAVSQKAGVSMNASIAADELHFVVKFNSKAMEIMEATSPCAINADDLMAVLERGILPRLRLERFSKDKSVSLFNSVETRELERDFRATLKRQFGRLGGWFGD
jgi:hypothetical protein